MSAESKRILAEGETCWRTGRAERASVLVDGAAYFGALRKSLLAAERSVFIVGWDIDSRTEIRGAEKDPDDDAPLRLGELLTWLVERKPDLRIHLLLWDYSVIYALERELAPSINLDWTTPERIIVCLDDYVPLGGSHHQKIVVVDDCVAYCGGLDLTIRRWDTAGHEAGNPLRVDPAGESYEPFHDIQMCVDGEAATILAELVRRRWREGACEEPMEIACHGDPWPEDLHVDFEKVEVGVARTEPALHRSDPAREVEALNLAAIDAAERWIYIENQFLTAECVAERLEQRLTENPELEVAVVAPENHWGWLEHNAMQVGRQRFMGRLNEAGVLDRVRLLSAKVEDADGDGQTSVMIHAKVMIVDDRFLRVGSSNLNNRSMGLDTECDLGIEARDDKDAEAVMRLHGRLLGEHLDVDAEKAFEALKETGSLFEAIDRLQGEEPEGRGLYPIEDRTMPPEETIMHQINVVADPEKPIESSGFMGDMFGGQPAGKLLGRSGKLIAVALLLVGLALAWRFTPLHDWLDPETVSQTFDRFAESAWAPIVVPLIYVLAGLVVFPITVLIAATAMVFNPWVGLAYAAFGALLSASVLYGLGAAAGRNFARKLMGKRINRISRALARRGVLSVAAVRMVPIAPFTLINMVAGISHIGFREYLAGTALGMLPGIVLMTALGNQLKEVVLDPGPAELGILALFVLAWLAVGMGLQFLVPRLGLAGR